MLYDYKLELKQQFKQPSILQQFDNKLYKIVRQVVNVAMKYFIIYEDLLFSKDKKGKHRVMIPDIMVHQLVIETHENFGHMGTYKIYELLHGNYQFPNNMHRRTKKIIKLCNLCQRSKINNQLARGPMISNIPTEPRQTISVDLMEPLPKGQLGTKFILALLDIFSKHVKLYPLRRATMDIILKHILDDYLPQFGAVQRILTDNGT